MDEFERNILDEVDDRSPEERKSIYEKIIGLDKLESLCQELDKDPDGRSVLFREKGQFQQAMEERSKFMRMVKHDKR